MSGGIAYVYDENGEFGKYCNMSMVDIEPVLSEPEQAAKIARDIWHQGLADETVLKHLIENHARYTGSSRAHEILEKWNLCRLRFVKVFPKEYKRALTELANTGRKAAA